MTPEGSWNTLRSSDDTAMLSFNHDHMIAYFVERQARNKHPAYDLKSMSSLKLMHSQKENMFKISNLPAITILYIFELNAYHKC